MKGIIAALFACIAFVAIVACVPTQADAGNFRVRGTPFRPFVGPVLVPRRFGFVAPRAIRVVPIHPHGFGSTITTFDAFGNPIIIYR